MLKGKKLVEKKEEEKKDREGGKMALKVTTPRSISVPTEAAPMLNKVGFPSATPGSIYSAILNRNHAVIDAKRLKNFIELRDKYFCKKVLFEDPLFPADDSSLFYSGQFPIKFEWKRPPVSITQLPLSGAIRSKGLEALTWTLSRKRYKKIIILLCLKEYALHQYGSVTSSSYVWGLSD